MRSITLAVAAVGIVGGAAVDQTAEPGNNRPVIATA